MKIAVVGVGGVGGYFAGRFVAAGHEVTLVARSHSSADLRERGLRVEAPDSDQTVHDFRLVDSPEAADEVDAVLVAVKSWQVPAVASSLKPMIGPRTVVLPVQNGVEAARQLAEAVGDEHVLGGVCMIIAYLVEPGHVRRLGDTVAVELGAIAEAPSTRGTMQQLRRALEDAGVECSVSPDIHRAIWRKFLLISSYGGVGALSRSPVGVTRVVPETRDLIEDAMREVVAVGRAHGVALDASDVTTMMGQLDAFSDDSTASMQRDIAEGRPSELEDQSGAVVRLGRAVDVSTPIHRSIYSCLVPSERLARGRAIT